MISRRQRNFHKVWGSCLWPHTILDNDIVNIHNQNEQGFVLQQAHNNEPKQPQQSDTP